MRYTLLQNSKKKEKNYIRLAFISRIHINETDVPPETIHSLNVPNGFRDRY